MLCCTTYAALAWATPSILTSVAVSSCPWHSHSHLEVENFSEHYNTSCLPPIPFACWEYSHIRLASAWEDGVSSVDGFFTTWEMFWGRGEGYNGLGKLEMGGKMQTLHEMWGEISVVLRQSWFGPREERQTRSQCHQSIAKFLIPRPTFLFILLWVSTMYLTSWVSCLFSYLWNEVLVISKVPADSVTWKFFATSNRANGVFCVCPIMRNLERRCRCHWFRSL